MGDEPASGAVAGEREAVMKKSRVAGGSLH
jgi:hypothetical protein